MSWLAKSGRWAYITFGALCLLVVGILIWATEVSLRLDQKQQTDALQKAHENRVRLAINQMVSWANPILFSEFRRDYNDYSPIYFPDEVRVRTGEVLRPDTYVQLSSLLTQPVRYDWFLLYFQMSPEGMLGSPQIAPEFARNWPGAFDESDFREWIIYERRLLSLAFTFAREDVAAEYDEKRGRLVDPNDPTDDGEELNDAKSVQLASAEQHPSTIKDGADYMWRRENVRRLQRLQTPRVVCTSEQVATANLTDVATQEIVDANDNEENVVGIRYENMVPLWTELSGRTTKDLMFLRALDVGGARVFQGFVVDWPRFSDELLAQVRDLFPNAELEIIDETNESPDDTTLSLIPARFNPNTSNIAVAGLAWNHTHSFLLMGWGGAIFLLIALGLGLRSMLQLSERRTQFAYAVTHELRTPLTTFQLYTDMLANGLVEESSRQEYLETLNQESRRLSGLVSGVLEHSRIESGSVPVSKELVPVSEILNEVREAQEAWCTKSGAKLTFENNSPDLSILTDRRLTVQILGNLIDNACKYGRNGDAAQVAVTSRLIEGKCALEVTDNGPGIPARLRSSIFKPYQRGEQHATTVTGGIGLGLALSRSWAKMLGGNLELVANGKGNGARFRLSLEPGNA
ncbi:MAG: HAMP domain-containing sensor histidine kinase [Phycisphaerae bacterium]